MSRYIDVDKIEMPLFESRTDETWMKVALNAAPTIDIVRCDECIYYHDDECHNGNFPVHGYGAWIETKADDFCSYGERKEGDSDE